MNEELQKALGALLNKANDGIDTAGNFLAAELPDVIQQLLMWHGVYNFILFFIGFVSILISTTLSTKVILNIRNKGHWSTNKDASDFSVRGALALALSLALCLLSIATLNMQWLQIWIAPKVWLLEYTVKLAG